MKYALLPLALLGAHPALADVTTIPTQSGFSGFVMGGVTARQYESNLFKGDKGGSRLDALDTSPSRHDALKPLFGADLRYTFAETGTQIFLGNLIQDAVRYDLTQQLGIRQQWGNLGILSAGYVFSAMPTETWSDPYFVSGERSETDYSTRGVRLGWDNIGHSKVNAAYTWRRSQVDDERSGQQLVSQGKLSQEQAAMLDRNGDLHRLEFSYDWQLPSGHLLSPALIYKRAELDGAAERSDTLHLQLTHALRGPQWSLVSNLYGGWRHYDEANPIYGQKADANEWGASSTFFWHRLFGVEPLSVFVSASWGSADADIDFYDSTMLAVSTGLMYRL